ncbi:DUF488 family protein [Legionella sp. 227]|uniref:DUF488 family protein n=1 Tax=Legionella sp. 227 TaxID=3367288 RepID=UPI00370D70B7
MPELFTIGHSTHTLQEFFEIVHAHQTTHLVDVRTIPRSRTVPWFNKEEFKNFFRVSLSGKVKLI